MWRDFCYKFVLHPMRGKPYLCLQFLWHQRGIFIPSFWFTHHRSRSSLLPVSQRKKYFHYLCYQIHSTLPVHQLSIGRTSKTNWHFTAGMHTAAINFQQTPRVGLVSAPISFHTGHHNTAGMAIQSGLCHSPILCYQVLFTDQNFTRTAPAGSDRLDVPVLTGPDPVRVQAPGQCLGRGVWDVGTSERRIAFRRGKGKPEPRSNQGKHLFQHFSGHFSQKTQCRTFYCLFTPEYPYFSFFRRFWLSRRNFCARLSQAGEIGTPPWTPRAKHTIRPIHKGKEPQILEKSRQNAVFVSLRPGSPSQQVFTQDRPVMHRHQSHIHPPHGICMGNMNKVQRKKVLFNFRFFNDFSYFFPHTLLASAGHSSQQLIVNPDPH